MFTLQDPDHPEFAGMTVADEDLPDYPMIDASGARELLRGIGARTIGQPRLVWGWSVATNSPYYPMWRVVTDSGTRYVTSTGDVLDDPQLQAPARG